MILHLITSPIILDYTIDQFEAAAKGMNDYYYLVSSSSDKDRIPERSDINIIHRNSPEHSTLTEQLDRYDVLILHSLNPVFYKFVLHAPDKLKIVWILFGTEIYSTLKKIRKQSFLPKTKFLFFLSQKYLIESLKPLYRFVIGRETNESYTKRCLKRIDFLALGQIKTYQYLVDNDMTKAKYILFNYYSIEETIGKDLVNQKVSDDHILIGNSSSYSNNHLDAFEYLNKEQLGNKSIIVPLSYGDRRLGKQVAKAGFRKFGKQFKPLFDFLPKQEYNKILLTCGFVIMNHLRPQARGNILTALWIGSKVFLHSNSILYQEFKEKGLLIFPINDIKNDPDNAFIRLNGSEVDQNRNILLDQYNYDKVLSATKKLVEIVTEEKHKLP